MASQVLSGTGNVTYTNSTGQNVRLVINYMSGTNIALSWTSASTGTGTASFTGAVTFGRSLATSNFISGSGSYDSQNMFSSSSSNNGSLPTEIMIATGQTFSATGVTSYNMIAIKEDGS